MATDGPLAGVRVLDLSNVLAGPYCCYQLAMMGADVIKVERLGGGDLARRLGADPRRSADGMGVSFLAQNAGKRSVTLDLKAPEGKDILRRLVRGADVLVENFRPGVMDRLGLGEGSLRAENPALIYCAISGFGQTGPEADAPAYDQIVQGAAGVMSITGDAGSAPLRVGYPVADTAGGMAAAFAICAALNAPERGAVLDISLTEAVLSAMGWAVSNHLVAGVDPAPIGNENMTAAPSGTFQTADAPINIAANEDAQWAALTRVIGREAFADDPEYADREARKRNRAALKSAIEAALASRPAADWLTDLRAAGVPCGPVRTVPESLAAPQSAARDLLARYPDPAGGGDIAILASPVVADGARLKASLPPPRLGADTDAILSDLGLAEDQIADLRARGVI